MELISLDGAALFYTSSTQPSTYSLLRSYILHRLHSTPQSTDNTSSIPTTQISRFPFMYRANVLDRDAVMVPSGWDTWGKINVLRDGFDPASILDLVQKDLEEEEGKIGKSLEDVWVRMIPDISRTKVSLPPLLPLMEEQQAHVSSFSQTIIPILHQQLNLNNLS